MSIEENKVFIRRAWEHWNRKELDAYFNLLTPGYSEHLTTGDMTLEQIKQFYHMLFTAFPDLNDIIEDIVAEGDKVTIIETLRGTYQGEFMGIAPTGKKIEV